MYKIGFGTWKMLDEEVLKTALKCAVECGYRLIDTASVYKNETKVGNALKELDIPREELFIQGKVWNKDRGYDKTLAAFEKSLEKLGLEYMDCYMIHWPASPLFDSDCDRTNSETYRAIERLADEGLVKNIGLCNFSEEPLKKLELTQNIKPWVNQIELHPGCRQQEIVDYCREKDIIVEAWSPLGSGAMLENKQIADLADKYGSTPAEVCLNWLYLKNIVPIVKSATPERIRANINTSDLQLEQADIRMLDDLQLDNL